MATIIENDLTPARKRKRGSEIIETNSNVCFTNSAFSSTPKKIKGSRRLTTSITQLSYNNNNCMEEKSIADLVKDKKEIVPPPPPAIFNPYEVQRKPPKKKKREEAIEEACFENPALNLNVPEKLFNPFEVVRHTDNREDQRKCFINEALNIKGQDSIQQVRNPYEISRENEVTENRNAKNIECFENWAMEDTNAAAAPTTLKIGIPFTPTVGCRIDFKNVSLSQLTPNKLLLAEKLVFSPVPAGKPGKRSLDAISEESSTTSIGKELDRYQLELENSINEAKLIKNDGNNHRKEEEHVYQLQLKIEKRVSLNQRLTEIPESEENEAENEEQNRTCENVKEFIETRNDELHIELKTKMELKPDDVIANSNETSCETKEAHETSKIDSEWEDDEDFDFKAPTPFVRSYHRGIVPKSNHSNSKESINSKGSDKLSSSECIAEKENRKSVKGFIRKSIRKIMPHNKETTTTTEEKKEAPTATASDDKNEGHKECTLSSHIMSSIRHSLRRKPKTNHQHPTTEIPMCEISIIDASERKMKLKSSALRNDYARIEELTNEKKNFLHNGGSLRRSVMKTIFHKQEGYSFHQ